jgi:hypothetical protein
MTLLTSINLLRFGSHFYSPLKMEAVYSSKTLPAYAWLYNITSRKAVILKIKHILFITVREYSYLHLPQEKAKRTKTYRKKNFIMSRTIRLRET